MSSWKLIAHRPTLWSRTNTFFAITLSFRQLCLFSGDSESVWPDDEAGKCHGSRINFWTKAWQKVMTACSKGGLIFNNTALISVWTLKKQNSSNPYAGKSLRANMWESLFYCLDLSPSTRSCLFVKFDTLFTQIFSSSDDWWADSSNSCVRNLLGSCVCVSHFADEKLIDVTYDWSCDLLSRSEHWSTYWNQTHQHICVSPQSKLLVPPKIGANYKKKSIFNVLPWPVIANWCYVCINQQRY